MTSFLVMLSEIVPRHHYFKELRCLSLGDHLASVQDTKAIHDYNFVSLDCRLVVFFPSQNHQGQIAQEDDSRCLEPYFGMKFLPMFNYTCTLP